MCAVVPWPERALHLVCVFDSSIWVMGGQANAPAQTAFVRATNSLSLSLSLSLSILAFSLIRGSLRKTRTPTKVVLLPGTDKGRGGTVRA